MFPFYKSLTQSLKEEFDVCRDLRAPMVQQLRDIAPSTPENVRIVITIRKL